MSRVHFPDFEEKEAGFFGIHFFQSSDLTKVDDSVLLLRINMAANGSLAFMA